MIRNFLSILQIIEIIGKWIFIMIKHYRFTLSIILFINFISVISSQENKFPWFTFFLILYLTFSFLKNGKKKQNQEELSSPTIHMKNENHITIENNTNHLNSNPVEKE